MSKEKRYKIQNRWLIDTENNNKGLYAIDSYIDEPAIDLLNNQDKQITDLKQQLERHNKYFNSFGCDSFDEFTDFISTFMLTPHEEQTLIKDLKKQLEESKEENKKLVKALNGDIFINYKVPMENTKLKQQLHDLPKKIVCEISEAIERLSWRKRIYTNWEFDKEQLYKDLDTILKKYGGENESK